MVFSCYLCSLHWSTEAWCSLLQWDSVRLEAVPSVVFLLPLVWGITDPSNSNPSLFRKKNLFLLLSLSNLPLEFLE